MIQRIYSVSLLGNTNTQNKPDGRNKSPLIKTDVLNPYPHANPYRVGMISILSLLSQIQQKRSSLRKITNIRNRLQF